MDFDHILPPLSQCFASHTTFFVETKKKIVVSFFSIRHRSLSKPRNKKHVRRRSKSADRVVDGDTGSSEDSSDREEKVGQFCLSVLADPGGARDAKLLDPICF